MSFFRSSIAIGVGGTVSGCGSFIAEITNGLPTELRSALTALATALCIAVADALARRYRMRRRTKLSRRQGRNHRRNSAPVNKANKP